MTNKSIRAAFERFWAYVVAKVGEKADASDLTSHTNNKSNPHEVTATQVGLGNVTNDAQVKRTEMGVSSGVATLDADTKVPVSQLPTATADTYGVVRIAQITDSGVSGVTHAAVTLECMSYISDNIMLPMLYTKADASDLTSHTGNTTIHITEDERTKWNTADTTASSVSSLVGDTAVSTQISDHNTSTAAHSDIRDLISGLTTRLNVLADSDDTTLDQLSEIVAYIKSNRTLIEEVTTNKVNVSDIIDNLTTNVSNKPLSAAQGVAIKSLIDNLQTAVNGKAESDHTHDVATTSAAGFISADDKTKLDGIETGANKTVVDSELSSTSTNPVQNNVVNSAISSLKTQVGDTSVSEQINTAIADKANTATTLSGYGIEDAYTKTEVDDLFSNVSVDTSSLVDTTTDQTVGGAKTFSSALTVNSDITATGTITGSKVYNAVWNDYAEWFEKEDHEEEFYPGEICIWTGYGIIKSYLANDSAVIGVVSDSYGHIIGGKELDNMEDNSKEYVPIGLKGRVKCNVIGTVEIGDLIVTSDIVGVGIVNNNAKLNTIIGKALESSSEEGLKQITILIN